MLTLMLCGAADTGTIHAEFEAVCSGLGAEAIHYTTGNVLHVNGPENTFIDNSRRSVDAAHICVFVIVNQYGPITWMTEFREVIRSGTPFLVLCEQNTAAEYRTHRAASVEEPDGDAPELYRAIAAVEREFVNLIEFDLATLADTLRRHLGNLVAEILKDRQQRNRRIAIGVLMGAPDRLGNTELDIVTEIALDDTEDKGLRKRALLALAARHRGLAAADVERLLTSWEQGVQRATAISLDQLYLERPASKEFLDMCFTVMSSTDDVGLSRRLAEVLFRIDLCGAIATLSKLELDDVGLRRRLSTALQNAEGEIVKLGVQRPAAALARRCSTGTSGGNWKSALDELADRLEGTSDHN